VNCYIGLDMGTSSVKGAIVSQDGKILGTASGNFRYFEKESGKLLDPKAFTDVCIKVINDLAALSGEYELKAICPCCASGNLLLLDEKYEPMTPIIGWQSTVDEAEFNTYYTDEETADLYNTVGWPALNSFPVAFYPWFFHNKKEMLENAGMICMSAEYLNFVLTGKWGISHSMGTPFYLMDQKNGTYNKKMLDKFGISEDKLPPIYDKGTVLGKVNNESLNVPKDTVIVLGSFDHPSGATGSGVYNEGEMLLSCGTSWVEFFPVSSREKAINAGFLVDRFMLGGAPYCVMASIASISDMINKLKKQFLNGISYDEFDKIALQSAMGCNGLNFSFTEEDYTKDVSGFNKSDIARAIIESAANLLKKNLEIAEEKGLSADKITIIGGITNSDVCVKIIAETLNKEITVVNGVSAGAVGAAMLGAIGAGDFKDEFDAFSAMEFDKKVYKP